MTKISSRCPVNMLIAYTESGEFGVKIHAIIRLTTSFGEVSGLMAGVEQFTS